MIISYYLLSFGGQATGLESVNIYTAEQLKSYSAIETTEIRRFSETSDIKIDRCAYRGNIY